MTIAERKKRRRRLGLDFPFGQFFIPSGPPPIIPIDPVLYSPFIASVSCRLEVVGGKGLIINPNTGTASAWTDNGDNATTNHGGQDDPALQPQVVVYTPTTVGLRFDGIDDFFDFATLNMPAPGTTPTWHFIIARQLSLFENVGGARMVSTIAPLSCQNIFQSGVTPGSLTMQNPNSVNENNTAVIGTLQMIEAYFSNSVVDFLRVAADQQQDGVSAANRQRNGFRMGADATPDNWMNFEMFHYVQCAGLPTLAERTLVYAAAATDYGVVTGVPS